MNFLFQPWEKLADAVCDGPADARVEVGGRQWLCRRCADSLWVARVDDEPRQHNFLLNVEPMTDEMDRSHWQLFIESDEQQKSMLRVWGLDQRLVVWYGRDGWQVFDNIGDWLNQDWEIQLPFQLGQASDAPSSAIYAALQDGLADDTSDFNFSARFLRFSPLEQNLALIETRGGTPQEWVSLLQTAVRAFAPQWPGVTRQMPLRFSVGGSGARYRLETLPAFGIRERTILSHIMRAYEPRQINLESAPSALQALKKWGRTFQFELAVAKPTTHEQLEAALALRAWLETHWPDGVRHLGKVV